MSSVRERRSWSTLESQARDQFDAFFITTRYTPGTQRRLSKMAVSLAADAVLTQRFDEDAEHL